MKTITQSLKNQENAIVVWWIVLAVSILMIFSPAVADWLIPFEATMAAAFVGIVMGIISIVMVKVYNNRKKLVASLFDGQSLMDVWECSDRYRENKGHPIQAYFSVKGIFYGGNPYPLKSYECTIIGMELIDDRGPALSVIYTVPNSRNGAMRHKSTRSIPVPEGKEEFAGKLVSYYSSVLAGEAARR